MSVSGVAASRAGSSQRRGVSIIRSLKPVRYGPGLTTAIWTPCAASSRCIASAIASSACFDAQYAPVYAPVMSPAIDDTNTILPRPRAIIPRATCCVSSSGPNTLVSNSSRTMSTGRSTSAPASPAPALFNSTSTSQRAACARSRAHVTSSFTASSASPRRAASALSSVICGAICTPAITQWPFAASRSATSRPKPEPAPVTRMRLPVMSLLLVLRSEE
ncbi:Uncharacterised protein [Burkholderia pseudomallei]|nr:Uncharacterised protein [Burkholderia pseudomallei]